MSDRYEGKAWWIVRVFDFDGTFIELRIGAASQEQAMSFAAKIVNSYESMEAFKE